MRYRKDQISEFIFLYKKGIDPMQLITGIEWWSWFCSTWPIAAKIEFECLTPPFFLHIFVITLPKILLKFDMSIAD